MGGGQEVAIIPTPDTSQGVLRDGEWFGPGRPLPGMAPRREAGRQFDYQFGTNIIQSPRADQATGFSMLRAFADRHDLTRLAIETCKDRMVRLTWGFGLIDSDDDLTPEQDARAKKFKTLLRRPDGKHFWVDWLRMLLEDLLVIDAASIFVRRTIDETEVVGLYPIDGATIKPVIDAGGREPDPPETAYQQFLKGVPAFNYTSRQLLYRPRNVRVQTVYGFSPVEQILATINIALRRQLWQHAYFTNGNIPDSLIGVPSTWTPDQIRDFQDWFDALLTGNTEKRRGALFVPGEVAKSYVPTKDAEMFGAAEEWISRLVCFAFGIPHQALVKEVNRATADNAAEQAIEDGLAPVMTWVKSIMDSILLDQFGEEELEFRWLDDKPMDPTIQDKIWKDRVDCGMADRNEWRAAVGEQPRPEPEASMLTTTSKATPLAVDAAIEQQKRRTASGVFPEMPAEGDDDPDNPTPPKPGKGKSSESGGSGGEEGGDQSPPSKLAKAAGPHDPDSLSESQRAGFVALAPTRRLVEGRRKALQRVLQRGLARVGGRVVAAVETVLEDASKAIDPGTEQRLREAAMAAVGSLDFLIDPIADILEVIAEDTSRVALAQLGSSRVDDIVDQVSERAVADARERAAELVGRRILSNGDIIDNPSARWAISESTRTEVNSLITRVLRENEGADTIIQELQDAHAFSPARAEMVSRTEVAGVNSRASMVAYREAEQAGVQVQKEWILGPNPCEVCQANASQGPIGLDDSFDSGDDTAPSHPNCECAVIPVVTGD